MKMLAFIVKYWTLCSKEPILSLKGRAGGWVESPCCFMTMSVILQTEHFLGAEMGFVDPFPVSSLGPTQSGDSMNCNGQ